MTRPSRDDIICMARVAGATPYTNRHYPDRPTHTFNPEQLQRFFRAAYEAGAAAERQRWAEVKSYLVAARDGSMSRNNSETLAGELLEQLERDIIEPASTAPVPVYCRHQWVSTGAMKPGECRCIQCGTWGLITPASTSPHTPEASPGAPP